MSKYLIRCDMRGVSGIVDPAQTIPGNPGYRYGCRMMTAELLALLEGLKAGGAEEVIAYDLHRGGLNLDIEKLPDFVRVICGAPPYLPDWGGGLDDSTSGVILMGFPSKSGTPGGLLPCTYDTSIRELRLNGVPIGEIGMEAAIAGDFNVPVLLVTSDSTGIVEATSLLPGVLGVAVKDSIAGGGVCYPLSVTTNLIRFAAEQAVNDPPEVKPYEVGSDVKLEVELTEGAFLKAMRSLAGAEAVKEQTLVLTGSTVLEVWAAYLERRRRVREGMVDGDL